MKTSAFLLAASKRFFDLGLIGHARQCADDSIPAAQRVAAAKDALTNAGDKKLPAEKVEAD